MATPEQVAMSRYKLPTGQVFNWLSEKDEVCPGYGTEVDTKSAIREQRWNPQKIAVCPECKTTAPVDEKSRTFLPHRERLRMEVTVDLTGVNKDAY